MPEISHQTLVIAIQAIAAEIRGLRETVASGEAEVDDFQLLEDHLRAAEDLERAYNVAARTVLNLPPYDELVGD
ncbi:hypothetical protein GCM10011611_25200 [Aliidongia dinghuensis]|uniref:Uncharacterized protein n=1 Tax=Aliidongia dinghuensis TaxID=1867774 RepID=A0A8J3E262_9PROT|nr:hypothetical protein [Aliidongia dinghuensis]GGF18280.1 hypothetical protein GCM10011611_25200 [Aliidongia dinghuensis]